MGKRFRGKLCAYCGAIGDTADHIFARGFFPKEFRADLPQVSSCSTCNNTKSQLEHYLLSVLPFGGNHPASSVLIDSDLPRRLSKNQRLHRELSEGREDIFVRQRGIISKTIALPLDGRRLEQLFVFVAKGLANFHWNVRISSEYLVGTGFLSSEGEQIFEKFFSYRPNAEARGDLGDGLILYHGIQGTDDPRLTFWRFQLYGGIIVSGDLRRPSESASTMWAMTSLWRMPGLAY